MSSNLLVRNVIRFIAIYLLQILILFNIELHPSINLFVYPIMFVLLPIRTPHALLLGVGFVLGILVGIQYNAVGEHAAAAVFTAFARPMLLGLIEPRGGYDTTQSAAKTQLGFSWFMQYAALVFFVHFVTLFTLEVFQFNAIVAIKIFFSYIISMLLIFLYRTLVRPKI